MDESTIKKLNELNHDFYEKIADSFSKTRQQPWQGWLQLLPIISAHFTQKSLTILDVGCGNGRFGQFLKENLSEKDLNYTGVDSNQPLLDLAKEKLAPLYTSDHLKLELTDFITETPNKKADLIVLFGVMHHIPSQKLREEKVLQLTKLLEPNGLLIFTAWQFDQIPSIFNRRKTAHDVGLVETDLEKNDYLLTWERDVSAIRYCHLVDRPEIQMLVTATKLKLLTQFSADGKNNQANEYIILKK